MIGELEKPYVPVPNDAQVPLPNEVALHVVAIQALRAEERNDVLPVGRGGRRGERALEMTPAPWDTSVGRPLPEHLAGLLVETEDLPDMIGSVRRDVIASDTARAKLRIRLRADRGCDEDLVFPTRQARTHQDPGSASSTERCAASQHPTSSGETVQSATPEALRPRKDGQFVGSPTDPFGARSGSSAAHAAGRRPTFLKMVGAPPSRPGPPSRTSNPNTWPSEITKSSQIPPPLPELPH